MRRAVAVASVLALAAVAGGCRKDEAEVRLPYYVDASLTPRWLSAEAARRVPAVGDFSLTDQHGATVRGAGLRGRVVVINFVYTRCAGICPTMVRHLKKVQGAFQGDPGVVLLSFSVDPDHDAPEALARYARAAGVGPAWHLLTGDRATIYGFARGSLWAESAIPGDRGEDDFLHTENLYLLDGQGRVRGVYNGTLPLDVDRLVEDASHLRARA